MARDVDTLVAQIRRWLPPGFVAMEPVLAGMVAPLALMEAQGEEFADSVTLEGAEGPWLSLLPRGYGIRRQDLEDDPAVRTRLRSPEDQITGPAILARVNALLEPYTAEEAILVEWWETGAYLDYSYYLGLDSRLSVSWHSFLVVIPDLAEWEGAYLDHGMYLDLHSYLGRPSPSVRQHIAEEIHRIRAAGVRAWLAIT